MTMALAKKIAHTKDTTNVFFVPCGETAGIHQAIFHTAALRL